MDGNRMDSCNLSVPELFRREREQSGAFRCDISGSRAGGFGPLFPKSGTLFGGRVEP